MREHIPAHTRTHTHARVSAFERQPQTSRGKERERGTERTPRSLTSFPGGPSAIAFGLSQARPVQLYRRVEISSPRFIDPQIPGGRPARSEQAGGGEGHSARAPAANDKGSWDTLTTKPWRTPAGPSTGYFITIIYPRFHGTRRGTRTQESPKTPFQHLTSAVQKEERFVKKIKRRIGSVEEQHIWVEPARARTGPGLTRALLGGA